MKGSEGETRASTSPPDLIGLEVELILRENDELRVSNFRGERLSSFFVVSSLSPPLSDDDEEEEEEEEWRNKSSSDPSDPFCHC